MRRCEEMHGIAPRLSLVQFPTCGVSGSSRCVVIMCDFFVVVVDDHS